MAGVVKETLTEGLGLHEHIKNGLLVLGGINCDHGVLVLGRVIYNEEELGTCFGHFLSYFAISNCNLSNLTYC